MEEIQQEESKKISIKLNWIRSRQTTIYSVLYAKTKIAKQKTKARKIGTNLLSTRNNTPKCIKMSINPSSSSLLCLTMVLQAFNTSLSGRHTFLLLFLSIQHRRRRWSQLSSFYHIRVIHKTIMTSLWEIFYKIRAPIKCFHDQNSSRVKRVASEANSEKYRTREEKNCGDKTNNRTTLDCGIGKWYFGLE